MKKILSVVLSLSLVFGGLVFSAPKNVSADDPNILASHNRANYTWMTSNANNANEGFCGVGSGFSAINAVNETLTNGNNMFGTTASTDEVAIYVNLGADYDLSSMKLYQGSTNDNFFDSYCTNFSFYYSTEVVNSTNQGADSTMHWVKAGECNTGTIYSTAKIKNATDISSTGDSIVFNNTCTARSVKVVFDKESCMGTGTNGNNVDKVGTVSILSLRVYGVEHQEESSSEETQAATTTTQAPTTTAAQTTTQAETIVNSDGDDTLYGSYDTNLAQGKFGYASSNDRANNNAGTTDPVKVNYLTDGNDSTYIVSDDADTNVPWFAVDLGSVQDINKIKIVPCGSGSKYTQSYPINYEIQVSPELTYVGTEAAIIESMSWTTVKTVTDGTADTRETTFAHQTTRWLRVKVNTYNSDYCSLFELYVFGTDKSKQYEEPTSAQTPTETTTESETIINSDGDNNMYGSYTTDLTSGQKGYASSNDRGSHVNAPLKVSYLTDGSENNYIVTHDDDTSPWFATDLGSVQDINKVKIAPGATDADYSSSYPISYEIQVSNRNKPIEDNEASLIPGFTWTTVATVTDGTLSSKEITFPHQRTRWLRIKVNTHNTENCSLKELYVYGTDKSTPYVEPTEPIDILFIGNSMTYYNTLCEVVEGLANHKGLNVSCTAATTGGKNLIYHSNADNVDSALKIGGYEIVVLQDVVSSFNASNLQTGAEACITKIKQYNPDAEIVFYEPFPRKDSISNPGSRLPEFTNAYISTALDTGAALAPAGETFYDIYINSGLDFYNSDGLHPQPLGTMISASTILYTLFPDLAKVDYTSQEQAFLDKLINDNVAYSDLGIQDSYSLETINLINAKGYYYAHAVNAAMDSGKTYTSIADANYEAIECEVTIDGAAVDTFDFGDYFTVPNTYELGYMDANDNSKVYKPGTKITLTEDLDLTAIKSVNVTTGTAGASARLSKSAPGIAFEATSGINGSKPIFSSAFTYGMVIAPEDIYYSDLNESLVPTNDKTKTADVRIQDEEDFFDSDTGLFKAGIMNLKQFNYDRNFIARSYVEIGYTDGSTQKVYSAQNSAARSLAGVSYSITQATAYYNTLPADQQEAATYFAGFRN